MDIKREQMLSFYYEIVSLILPSVIDFPTVKAVNFFIIAIILAVELGYLFKNVLIVSFEHLNESLYPSRCLIISSTVSKSLLPKYKSIFS